MSEKKREGSLPTLRFPDFLTLENWGEYLLDDVATFSKGKGISKSDVATGGSLPCIRYGQLYTLYGETIDKIASYTNIPAEKLVLSKSNDVIIPASGETKLDIATASCVKRSGIALGGDLNIIRSNNDGVFLSYYLNSAKKKDISRMAQGISVIHLYANQLKTLAINLPHEKEQKKIADCLSSIDELITVQIQKHEALKAQKKGLMQQLFPAEGETVPKFRFPEFLAKGEWKTKKIEGLAKRGSGHTPNKKNAEYYNGGINWVSLADSKKLDNGLIFSTSVEISQEGLDNSSAVLHPTGSVIISRDAGVGKSAVLNSPMAVSQHFIAWQCNKGGLSNWYLYYLLQLMKPAFESIAVGNTIKTIGLPYFKELHIPAPSIDEQLKVANCLTSVDGLITSQAKKIEALKTHKKGLMQQLFPSVSEVDV